MPAEPMPTVYVVEPQALFGPELARLVHAAGGRVVGHASVLDLDAIISASPSVALLDLDYTDYDLDDVLRVLRAEAPAVRAVVLSAQRGAGWLDACRANGAASVIAKAASERELVHDLRVVFDGGAVWDHRVEVAGR
jgi:DNA-binding NarL/FixJ family response regulator